MPSHFRINNSILLLLLPNTTDKLPFTDTSDDCIVEVGGKYLIKRQNETWIDSVDPCKVHKCELGLDGFPTENQFREFCYLTCSNVSFIIIVIFRYRLLFAYYRSQSHLSSQLLSIRKLIDLIQFKLLDYPPDVDCPPVSGQYPSIQQPFNHINIRPLIILCRWTNTVKIITE